MNKSHFVVTRGDDGEPRRFPMKSWLREHPDHVPPGLSASDSTSSHLRRGLKKAGWEVEELEDRVLLIRPDRGDTSFAERLLTDTDETAATASAEEAEEAAELTFSLERDLQAALRANIAQLEPGLSVSDAGRETTTEVGRIDITAKDSSGYIVVIELKAGTASPSTVAQILAYMGALAGSNSSPVRGILVAADFHPRVILAAKAVANLQLVRYTFQFTFHRT